jgi:hypothetical protein
MDDTDDLRLELGDRIAVIAERLGRPDAYSSDNPSLRNLNLIWNGYIKYLRNAMKRGLGPGYPIHLVDDSFMLERLLVGPKWFTRDWFTEGVRASGGTEIIWIHPSLNEGYQWWIMSWTWNRSLLTINVTHWMVQHDDKLRRNTIYFIRQFTFREDPGKSEYPLNLVESNTILDMIPDHHRRRVMDLAKHATRTDPEDWVLTVAPYGLFEFMFDLHNMIKVLDIGDTVQYYLDREFKAFWLRRVLDILWGDTKWKPHGDQIDFDGLLNDTWIVPRTEHPMDRDRFNEVYQEWTKFREWYLKAREIYEGVVIHKRPFSEMVTDAQEPAQQ